MRDGATRMGDGTTLDSGARTGDDRGCMGDGEVREDWAWMREGVAWTGDNARTGDDVRADTRDDRAWTREGGAWKRADVRRGDGRARPGDVGAGVAEVGGTRDSGEAMGEQCARTGDGATRTREDVVLMGEGGTRTTGRGMRKHRVVGGGGEMGATDKGGASIDVEA